MTVYEDARRLSLCLTDERLDHVRKAHPELSEPLGYLEETVRIP